MNEPCSEQTIFLEARSFQSEVDRAVFLKTACKGDIRLLKRLEALLDADRNVGDFLDELPEGAPALAGDMMPPQQTPHAGEVISRYKLLEVIGEGGCGVVYMAEQLEPIRRRVALKLIKLGMDTKAVSARFEAERQALAMMDHPNIAKVLDGGATASGRPYFVMDLVRGVRITDYCDDALLTIEERLRLFLEICAALQHAHQKGIIHRDLKPSNILVTVNDGVAVPKIIDFGIAKAIGQRLTEKTVFTNFNAFIGTPSYTSPEQAEMSSVDIDTRSDIYSLGVLLYELLTGFTPFDAERLLKSGLDEMRRVIRNQEPAAPSNRFSTLGVAEATEISRKRHVTVPELTGAVRGDLDWIILKCLEKDRSRRYDTASGLAADIKRHLQNEPITARPQTAFIRATKWVRRNKALFTSGVCVAVALLIGSSIGISQYVAKSRALDQVLRAQLEQEALRKEAQQRKAQAELAAARSGQIADFLKDMLRSVAPGVAQGKDTKLLRDVLDRTAGRIERDLKTQPQVQADLYSIVGQTYADLTLHDRAEKMFQAAVDRLLNIQPQSAALARALGQLAVAQATQGKTVAAQPNADKALDIARRLNDPILLSEILRHKARSLDPDQDVPEAVPYLREALSLQRTAGTNLDAEGDILRELGGALAWGTNLAEADRILRDALALHEKIGSTNDFSLGRDWFNLSQIAVKRGDFSEAERDIRNSLSIVGPILDRRHQSRVDYTAFLAHYLALQGKWDEAEAFLKSEKAAVPNDPRYRLLLGTLYAREKAWTKAADELLSATSPLNDPNFAPLNTIVALLKAHRTNDSLILWRDAMARSGRTLQFDVADKLAKAGLLLPIAGAELGEAAALADYASTAKGPSWLVPWVTFVKSLAELRRQNFDVAAGWAERSYNDRNATAPCRAGALIVGAMANQKIGRHEEAVDYFQKGTKLVHNAPPETGNFEGRWAPWAIAEILSEEAALKLGIQSTSTDAALEQHL